jgi:hypothetical protein
VPQIARHSILKKIYFEITHLLLFLPGKVRDPRVEDLAKVEVVSVQEITSAAGELESSIHLEVNTICMQRTEVEVEWSSKIVFYKTSVGGSVESEGVTCLGLCPPRHR